MRQELMVTKDELHSRIKELENSRDNLNNNIIQLQANLSAHNGAIEDCYYWLKKFDEAKPSSELEEIQE